MMKSTLPLFALLLTAIFLHAQNDLPNTQVYLFDLEQTSDSTIAFEKPQYLTEFNKFGYNNQPNFVSNDELFISVRLPQEQQTDIYALNLENKTKLQVTKTAESEYSPTLMPDLYNFSAIRVELDGNNTQRLWQFPISRQNKGKPVFQYLTDIGYHYWMDKYRVVLFIVDEPNYLVVGDTRDGGTTHLATNIGRCFQKLSNGNLAYVHKATEGTWLIKTLSQRDLRSEIVVTTLAGSEDFVVLRDGTYLMGQGSKLYKFHPAKDEDWREVGDFSAYNIKKISRMAVNKNGKLALVGS